VQSSEEEQGYGVITRQDASLSIDILL
jgi:hypothetical protein